MAFLGRPGLRSGAVSDGRHLLAETLSRFRSQSLRPLDQRVPGTLADVQRRSRGLPGSPIGASAVAVFARPGTVASSPSPRVAPVPFEGFSPSEDTYSIVGSVQIASWPTRFCIDPPGSEE